MLASLEEIQKFKIEQQYTVSGRRNVIHYGRLLSYLSDVRRFQGGLGCGRVYSSTYLGVEPRPQTLEKAHVLVVFLLPGVGATYENQPISLVRMLVGGGKRRHGEESGQVVLHLRDLQTRQFKKTFVFNTDNPIDTAKPILEFLLYHGLTPIKSSDYYFGQYRTELQYVFDNVSSRLDAKDMAKLKECLKGYDFVYKEDSCGLEFGSFRMKIYRKNMYGSFILAFQDLEDEISVHWAVKGETLTEIVAGLLTIYERWRDDTKGRR